MSTRVYKDTAQNRKLGRVGKPIPPRKNVKSVPAQVWVHVKKYIDNVGECVIEVIGVYFDKQEALEEQEKHGGILIPKKPGSAPSKVKSPPTIFEELGWIRFK